MRRVLTPIPMSFGSANLAPPVAGVVDSAFGPAGHDGKGPAPRGRAEPALAGPRGRGGPPRSHHRQKPCPTTRRGWAFAHVRATFTHAHLPPARSERVRPPRLKACPAQPETALERPHDFDDPIVAAPPRGHGTLAAPDHEFYGLGGQLRLAKVF
ncbi:hypothetical protein [Deinococcus hopiensis]|uniref:Uncharacterized protein n=1 Tax=Deinococcus hopiensis KR-140 TaxID=695939 RepID=A0A1W1VJH6_9DEIO|nr:hypothetical protein [Deinococcus hopiensis]SMB93478.1 hypothetical protein SAMN00790413_02001 [Deinococcus hopiensis KR-140]